MEKFKINPDTEYSALRDEILKKMDLMHQTLNIKFAVVASFIGFGISNNLILLSLPLMVLIFCLVYKSNGRDVNRIGKYLSENYEIEQGKVNWEAYSQQIRIGRFRGFYKFILALSNPMLFLIPSLFALTIGIIKSSNSLIENVLIWIGVVSIIFIVVIFLINKRDGFKKEGRLKIIEKINNTVENIVENDNAS